MRSQLVLVAAVAGLLGASPGPVSAASGDDGASAPAAGASGAPLDLRHLSTVVEAWSRKERTESLTVHEGTVFSTGDGQVRALAAVTGQPLWSRDLREAGCCGADLIVAGDTVAVEADNSVFLLNAADGASRGEIDLGGAASMIAGPPVVALDASSNALTALSAASGQMTNRLPLAETVDDLAVQDGYLVLVLEANSGDPNGAGWLLAGYRAGDLQPIWRQEIPGILPELQHATGQIFALRLAAGPGDREMLAVNPATGDLGRPLSLPAGAHHDPDWPPGIESVALAAGVAGDAASGPQDGGGAAGGGLEELRRLDAASGKQLWATDLPCRVQGLARVDANLYASCAPAAGRGLLVALSWTSGDVRQIAYGLPAGKLFAAAGDLVLVGSDEELAAFSTTELGPPDATASLADEVRRILLDTRGDATPTDRGSWIANRLRDLAPVGPPAFPLIARWVPAIGPTSLVAAADALAAGTYRAGAAALASRLAGGLEAPQPTPGWEGWNPRFAILRALATLAGDAEVPAIAALLAPGNPTPGALRREALATLVAMRSPAADQAVRAFLASPLPNRVTWRPPCPTASSPRLLAALPDGRRLMLFRQGFLGNPDDLWAAEVDVAGVPVAPPLFTGQALSPQDDLAALAVETPTPATTAAAAPVAASPPAATAAATAPPLLPETAVDRVDLRNRRGSLVASFSLAQIARDSDGDGLSDLVERRLRLDPANPDTDGDGLPDGVDPAPNARQPQMLNQDQEINAALFSQFFRLAADDATPPEIAVVVSDFALEWRGRRDATITLDAREAERFRAETAGGGLMVTMRRGEPAALSQVAGDPPGNPPAPANDEEVYTLSLERGALHRQVYRAFLRNLSALQPGAPAQWAISRLRLVDLR